MDQTVVDPIEQDYEDKQAWGLLASIDLHECNPETIKNPAKIRAFVYELCERINMVRHGECHIERFGDGDLEGYSMFQFIETSSITAHFDEKISNAAYIDIFSCKYFSPTEATLFAKEFFEATDYNLTYTLRK
jgi:S-adenosylmethionine/arginine decarboxylase-like enzyme